MKCPNCQYEIKEEATICNNCFFKLNSDPNFFEEFKNKSVFSVFSTILSVYFKNIFIFLGLAFLMLLISKIPVGWMINYFILSYVISNFSYILLIKEIKNENINYTEELKNSTAFFPNFIMLQLIYFGIIIMFFILGAFSSIFFIGGFSTLAFLGALIYLGILFILFIGLVYPVYRLAFFTIFEKNWDAIKALKYSYKIFMKKIMPISVYLTYIYGIQLLLNVVIFAVMIGLINKIYPNFSSDISNVFTMIKSGNIMNNNNIITMLHTLFYKFAFIMAVVYLLANLISMLTPLIWASTYIKYFEPKKYDFTINP